MFNNEGYIGNVGSKNRRAATFTMGVQDIRDNNQYKNRSIQNLGNKMILPEFVLQSIYQIFGNTTLPYPLIFEVTNSENRLVTHCGVFEYSATQNGVAYLPGSVMKSLEIPSIGNQTIRIKLTPRSLPKASKLLLQPISADFATSISNPEATLLFALESYQSLTVGDIITIPHGHKSFDVIVKDATPAKGTKAMYSKARIGQRTGYDKDIFIAHDAYRHLLKVDTEEPEATEMAVSAVLLTDADVSVEFEASLQQSTEEEMELIEDEAVVEGTVGVNVLQSSDQSTTTPTSPSTRAVEAKHYKIKLPASAKNICIQNLASGASYGPEIYLSFTQERPSFANCDIFSLSLDQTHPTLIIPSSDPVFRLPTRHDKFIYCYLTVAESTSLTTTPYSFRVSSTIPSSLSSLKLHNMTTLTGVSHVLPKGDTVTGDGASAGAGAGAGETKPGHELCTSCQQWIPSMSLRMHSLQCARLSVRCKESYCGKQLEKRTAHLHCHCSICGEVVAPSLLSKHERLFHSRVRCEVGCGVIVFPDEMKSHVMVCEARVHPCAYCGASFASSALTAHESYCRGKSRPCAICSVSVISHEMDHHLATKHGINPSISPIGGGLGSNSQPWLNSNSVTGSKTLSDLATPKPLPEKSYEAMTEEEQLEFAIKESLKGVSGQNQSQTPLEDMDEDAQLALALAMSLQDMNLGPKLEEDDVLSFLASSSNPSTATVSTFSVVTPTSNGTNININININTNTNTNTITSTNTNTNTSTSTNNGIMSHNPTTVITKSKPSGTTFGSTSSSSSKTSVFRSKKSAGFQMYDAEEEEEEEEEEVRSQQTTTPASASVSKSTSTHTTTTATVVESQEAQKNNYGCVCGLDGLTESQFTEHQLFCPVVWDLNDEGSTMFMY